MTTTSQAPLSLPPTFSTSFWPSYPSFASYRAAVSHLYSILQHGIDEDTALLALVDEIANSHWNYVDALKEGTAAQGRIANKVKGNKPIFKGARANAPSSSLVAALHTATIDPLAASHVRTANALTRTILEPFGQWSQRHVEQVTQSWKTVEEWLDALEEGQDEVSSWRAGKFHENAKLITALSRSPTRRSIESSLLTRPSADKQTRQRTMPDSLAST